MYCAKVPSLPFIQAINTAFKIVPKGSSLRILDNIRISGNGSLQIRATDLDGSVMVQVPISGEGNEDITANGKAVYNICKTLSKRGNIELKIFDNCLSINGAVIAGNDINDYPGVPQFEKEPVSGIIPRQVLINAFEQVAFACAKDESRACLAGVLLQADINGFELVGTDGHRLARKTITEYKAVRDFPKYTLVVPPKHVLNWLKSVDDSHIKITCSIPENGTIKYIRFNTRASSLIVKLIEGPYPQFEKVLPTYNPKTATFYRDKLISAVESLLPLCNQKTYLIRFHFGAENSLIVTNKEMGAEKTVSGIAKRYTVDYRRKSERINTYCREGSSHRFARSFRVRQSSDCMENREKGLIAKSSEEKQKFHIGFNGKYLLEILRKIDGDKVTFRFNSPISGCLINGGTDGELFLLMPLRIKEN